MDSEVAARVLRHMPPIRSSYDAVIIGGGHNGLVAAAYLAKAGLSVLLLERTDTLGGTPAEVYNVWFDWIHWAVPHKSRVHGVQTPLALPDGTLGATDGIGYPGGISETQIWVDDAQ